MKRIVVKGLLIAAILFVLAACGDAGDASSPALDESIYYRIVSQAITGSSSETTLWKYSYNSDGSLKQTENCNSSGTVNSVTKYTYSENGLRLSSETSRDSIMINKRVYEYNNGVLKKSEYYYFNDSLEAVLSAYTIFTFLDGRKLKEESFDRNNIKLSSTIFQYDNSGKRTVTTTQNFNETGEIISTSTGVRTYNSNGTISSISFSDSIIVRTFIWEETKKSIDNDMFFVM